MPRSYVYKVINSLGQIYFGARWANKLPASEDFGVVYKTSSVPIKSNFDLYHGEIIAEFFDKKRCI